MSNLLPAELCISEPVTELEELEYIETLPNVKPPLLRNFTLSDISADTQKRCTIDLGTRVLQHQLHAIIRSLPLAQRKESWVLIGGTGTGKTFYYSGLFNEMRRLFPKLYPPELAILFITESKLCIDVSRVFKQFGCVNVQVVGYEAMRSTLGEMYITWKTEVIDGLPQVVPVWCSPLEAGICLICCDECQKLKNDSSQTSNIIRFAARANYQIIFSSATPFSRACHVRTIAVALQPLIKWGNGTVRLTDKLYPVWLRTISDNPLLWTPADMKRVMKALAEQIIHFENVRFAHVFKIRQIVIPFAKPEHRAIYDEAFEEYQQLRLTQERDPLSGFAAVLVGMMKFRQKSELLRGEYLAKSAVQCVNSKKRPINAIIACDFRDTMFLVKSVLLTKYKVDPTLISEIHGDQNKKERQINIDRFNNESARYIIISFRAGGTGLSLHHTKDKRYPSEIFLPPVWNSEDLVQILGRAHRVTSCSTTYQNIIWFANTIEETVAERVKGKMSALKEVVGHKENWTLGLDGSLESRSAVQLTVSQLAEDEEDENAATADTLLTAVSERGANALVHKLEI